MRQPIGVVRPRRDSYRRGCLEGPDVAPPPAGTWDFFAGGLIPLEILLGVALVLNYAPQITKRVALFLFAAFAGYSLQAAIEGQPSCGCFGAAKIDPRIAFTVDVAAVVLLALSGVSSFRAAGLRVATFRTTAVGATLLSAAGLAGWLLAGAERGGSVGVVVNSPEDWIGQHFPLHRDIDIGDELSQGTWRVLLYHHDCPKCRVVLSAYANLRPLNGYKFAAIELPPHSATRVDEGTVRYGRLQSSRTWYVMTPCEIELENGKVTRCNFDFSDIVRQTTRF